ncbi:Ankyrin repeat and KH domain-containing protein 1 [Daldinia childiae]|uniref:Ankyrin repeat and KH domain-containing protein 1 n=1 Tax=Daldinia childiae TaxID=326645 RepID=UPI001446B724|nr:Ankyrin repeat and KH domain-containing protein 1 [Daldinia childiae]KAF3058628.1 Ankyrin repeat and KH domain-containing protein 1 [Daldinia childiae]
MENHGSISNISNPASFNRVFNHFREYPPLPTGYNWETQKQQYCPRDRGANSRMWDTSHVHQFGYVFCHRGLYERASRFIDNSNSAIKNGLREGFFLQEVDVFPGKKIKDGFLAHDQTANRVTSKKGSWKSYPAREIFETTLVSRVVDMLFYPRDQILEKHREANHVKPEDLGDLDFESTYLDTYEKVPRLESTILKTRIKDIGLTLQLDLRNDDFATGIAHYIFHLANNGIENSPSRVRFTPAWDLFRSTMLKGYNKEFNSFEHLVQTIKKKSKEAYGVDVFKLEFLHQLPPLIMVFYSDSVVELAENDPLEDDSTRKSYKHIHDVFKKHVSSFIGIGKESYNFILEITHSGLGLLYDVETGKARNPLTGAPLRDETVVFNSLVDRAMIDVSLELRREHPDLLFCSCTRLPDVIASDQKYKAHHQSGNMVGWERNEEKGLAAKLRAIHGGLYPQSNIAVADDPIAEIAVRTWIDQNSALDRSELLQKPYYEWLRQAGTEVYDAVNNLNGDFLPNRTGDPVDSTPTNPGTNSINLGSPPDSTERTRLWRDDVNDIAQRESQLTNVDNEDSQAEEEADLQQETYDVAAYKAAEHGNDEVLQELIFKGADINASTGFFGSALAVACAKGHYETVQILLDNGANINGPRNGFCCPLQVASHEGHVDIIQLLLDKGVDINASNSIYGTALADACAQGHEDIVKLLLARGADVNAPTGSSKSPLEAACIMNHDTIVQRLLAAGADVNIPINQIVGSQHPETGMGMGNKTPQKIWGKEANCDTFSTHA